MFDRYFGVPQSLVRLGMLGQMKPTEVTLYICLLHESERYRTRELQRTDAQLHDLARLSSRACRDARIKLQERGLVRYRRGRGNVYIYTLCNPETGKPWPGDPRRQIRYVKKSDRAPQPVTRSAPTGTTPTEREQQTFGDVHGVPLSFNRPM
jgi:predicted DNA-binding transcriptional regulator